MNASRTIDAEKRRERKREGKTNGFSELDIRNLELTVKQNKSNAILMHEWSLREHATSINVTRQPSNNGVLVC